MSQFISNPLKLTISLLIIAVAVFFTIVSVQKNSTLIITMHNEQGNTLYPQVYFSDKSYIYSEQDSRKAFKVRNNQYYFSLPNLKTIQHLRFDPVRHKHTVTIDSIHLTEHDWFREIRYNLPLNILTPRNQIAENKLFENTITFSTTGNDPQFDILFQIKEISTSRNLHIILLLTLLLTALVCSYLLTIYKSQTFSEHLSTKLILYSLFLAFALFKVDYYKDHIKKFYPPDELAHLAYISYIHKNHDLLPQFENMRMLNNEDAQNYLSHPPLYYHIMNLVYDKNIPIYQNVNHFRELNIMIFMTAFLLLLYLGFSSKLSTLGHFVYLSFTASIPMYAYSGGSITNDNLAILGALIFIIGLKKILEKNYSTISFFILGFGIFLAYFSKLTAAILIFFTLIFFILYAIKSHHVIKISMRHILLLLLFILPILYYQFYIIQTYHSLLPTMNATNPEQYKHSSFFVQEQNRIHFTPIQWIEHMLHYIKEGWFGIHSHHSFVKNTFIEYIGLLILHIFAVITLFLKCKDENSTSYCLIGKFGLLALFTVLIVQYIFSYKTHLSSGYMGGLQPRYLLPFMFSFAIMASIFVERYKNMFIFNIFIIVLCIHAIYSDFFYFLNYYT